MSKILSLLLLSVSVIIFAYPLPIFADGIYTTEKLITVDLTKQTLYAWEGGKIVHFTKVSTGLPGPETETPKGSFRIRSKIRSQRMRGGSKKYGQYDYKNVPYVMYFYQGYAIHGAYWHKKFGRRASHGCVNLPVDSAEIIYNWADIGTRVEIF